jgi:hypothetical protein
MKKFSLLALVVILPSGLLAGEVTRIPLQQVRPAYPISRGHLYAQIPVRFFFQDQILELAPNLYTGETYWDIQNSLSLFYGLHEHVDLSLQQIIYQDNHKPGTGYNLPDDLFLRARLAGFGNPELPWRYGGQIELRLPVADYHNLPLEPYAADRAGMGVSFLASHLASPDNPGRGRTLNANLGFFFHNDRGLVLTTAEEDTLSAAHNSSEFIYGLSVTQILGRFDLQAELYGRAFMRKPAATAYTRENYLYFTPAISYMLPSTIQLQLAADVRLSGNVDDTDYLNGNALPWKSLPNVPEWRLTAALTVPLIPFPEAKPDADKPVIGDYSQQQLEQELYRQLAAERKKAEEAEANLARIRAERERIDKIMQQLGQTLESHKVQPADSTSAPTQPLPETPLP